MLPTWTSTGDILAAAVLAVVTVAIVLILVLTARRTKDTAVAPKAPEQVFKRRETGRSPAVGGRRWPCPVCGALLGAGERVRSVVRLSPTRERIMEISGCPQCLPPSSRRRTCPVCRANLAPHELLIARIFDRSKENRKPHVHVLGCTRCHR